MAADLSKIANCRKCRFSKGWDMGGECGTECRHPKFTEFKTGPYGMQVHYADAEKVNRFGNCEYFTTSKNIFKIIFG